MCLLCFNSSFPEYNLSIPFRSSVATWSTFVKAFHNKEERRSQVCQTYHRSTPPRLHSYLSPDWHEYQTISNASAKAISSVIGEGLCWRCPSVCLKTPPPQCFDFATCQLSQTAGSSAREARAQTVPKQVVVCRFIDSPAIPMELSLTVTYKMPEGLYTTTSDSLINLIFQPLLIRFGNVLSITHEIDAQARSLRWPTISAPRSRLLRYTFATVRSDNIFFTIR